MGPTTGFEFIMRLRPNVTNEELAAICTELATNATSRFNGTCIMHSSEQSAAVQAVEEPDSPVAWSFQTFTVDSEVRPCIAV